MTSKNINSYPISREREKKGIPFFNSLRDDNRKNLPFIYFAVFEKVPNLKIMLILRLFHILVQIIQFAFLVQSPILIMQLLGFTVKKIFLNAHSDIT